MRHYITGDTHGEIDVGKLNNTRWAAQHKLTHDDCFQSAHLAQKAQDNNGMRGAGDRLVASRGMWSCPWASLDLAWHHLD